MSQNNQCQYSTKGGLTQCRGANFHDPKQKCDLRNFVLPHSLDHRRWCCVVHKTMNYPCAMQSFLKKESRTSLPYNKLSLDTFLLFFYKAFSVMVGSKDRDFIPSTHPLLQRNGYREFLRMPLFLPAHDNRFNATFFQLFHEHCHVTLQ